MALPKLETPTYKLTIPSSGNSITYRPFLVKEEKILLLAQESDDENQVITSIKNIIESCTFGKVDVNSLTISDLEYLFLQVRAKSVGETTKILLRCEKSGENTEVEINISDVYPKSSTEEVIETTYKLSDEVGIKLKPILVKDLYKLNGEEEGLITQSIASVIGQIYDKETLYDVSTVSDKELTEFIDSLTHEHLQYIQKYINSLPQCSLDVEFVGSTGHKNKHTIRGIRNFFG
jgi:hypothetical protein